MGELVLLPRPEYLTSEQREHWESEADYWTDIQEEAVSKREHALRMLGTLPVEAA